MPDPINDPILDAEWSLEIEALREDRLLLPESDSRKLALLGKIKEAVPGANSGLREVVGKLKLEK